MTLPSLPRQVAKRLAALLLLCFLEGFATFHAFALMNRVASPDQAGSQRAELLLAAAAHALSEKNFDLARRLLNQALLQKPVTARALFMMADLDMRSDHPDAAIPYFRRALQLVPGSFPGHYELALALLREKRTQDGLRELRRAVQIDPRQPDAAYNLALVELEAGNPGEAIDRLRQARALAPESPDLSYNLARAEFAVHQPQAAIAEAESSAAQFGQDPQWRIGMAKLFLDRDQPKIVEVLLNPPSGSEEYFLLGSAALSLGQVDEAARDSESSLQADRHNLKYLLLNARIDQQRNQQAAALKTLGQAALLTPNSPEILYSQAVSYYFLTQYDHARQSLDQAAEHATASARALFLYAMTYENEGNANQAIKYLRRAVALNPGDARFQCHLAVALLETSETEKARQGFVEAIRLQPSFALPHYELGKLLARQKKFDAAAQELNTSIHLQPDLAPALYELSRVYAALGSKQQAADTLAQFLSLKSQQSGEQQALASDAGKQLQSP